MMEMFSLQGKIALITGAAGLLGECFANSLADAGAKVALADIDEATCRKRSDNLGGKGSLALKMDVTDKNSVRMAMDAVIEKFGGLDILVNAAYRHIDTLFEERTVEDFNAICRVNLTGTFLCSQTAAGIMKKKGGGNIINIGSIYGIVAADPGLYEDSSSLKSPEVYAATKAGIIHITKYLAVHLAQYNIRVNCISPGGIFNNQSPAFLEKYACKVPLRRMARPEEITGALVFLASDASSYVTGHNLVVDGGFTIW